MNQKYSTLIVKITEGIVHVTINRPQSLNALSREVISDLEQVLQEILQARTESPHTVQGVILCGSGDKAFVAGADIKQMSTMTPEEGDAFGKQMHAVTLQLERLPVPVIAAVDGFALGGGCELALACDFIYATTSSMFGQPETKLGLIPGFGGTVRLQQRIGIGRARELIYTGRMITADQAHRQGLVNSVYATQPDVLAAAQETLRLIAANSQAAIAISKRVVNEVQGLNTVDGLGREASAFKEAFTTPEMREGTRAFCAKEEPRFRTPLAAKGSHRTG